jgi:excisionase family DNA binding protein
MAKETKETEPIGAFKLGPACRYAGKISQMTMRRLIDRGEIKPCRNLRHLLIPKAELDRWLTEGQGLPVRRRPAGAVRRGGRAKKEAAK